MTPEDQSSSRWLPDDWTSKSGWLESAHRAARTLRRDVAHATPQQIRHALDMASRLNPGPWGGEYHEVGSDSRSGAEVTWKERQEGTVMWIHGGAFAFGSPRVYRAAAIHLARCTRCRVWIPSYRLAPEHPYPAAHDDVLGAIRNALDQGESFVLVGDSAGGNLALGALLRLREEGRDLSSLKGLALLSPWCDLRINAKSIAANDVAHSPFDHRDSMEYSQNYLAGHDAEDPRVSALAGMGFDNFPSTYLEWSNDEFLAPDIEELCRVMLEAGVDLTVRTEPSAIHGWQTLPDLLPEARRSSEALGAWARHRLGLPVQRGITASKA